jgi:hypothetical protein
MKQKLIANAILVTFFEAFFFVPGLHFLHFPFGFLLSSFAATSDNLTQVLKRAKILNSHRQSCKINPSQKGTEETSCGHHSDDTIDDKSSNEKSVSVAIVKLSDVAAKDETR